MKFIKEFAWLDWTDQDKDDIGIIVVVIVVDIVDDNVVVDGILVFYEILILHYYLIQFLQFVQHHFSSREVYQFHYWPF
jgi:hypothetical protein